ncbi:uncharacterized protein LOC125653834 [Ostrea edulis]|uniref:uncharacterized protein LOC125653834 n=1 Tax=Ostrea edulis TaxID=37623 RepID=UPI0024AFC319|nr:uncharacterized protein LOC125653834 [Ostrea edulis]
MPWTDVIMTCVEFKVTGVDFTVPNSETGVEELMVVCDQDVLSNFNPPTDWRYLENDQDREETVSLEKTFYRAAAKEWTQRKSLGNIKTKASKAHHKEGRTPWTRFPEQCMKPIRQLLYCQQVLRKKSSNPGSMKSTQKVW